MRGRDITRPDLRPAHRLFNHSPDRTCATSTIGIGDGGNEIGMGKIPHETIVKNIPNGDLIHCRVPTDHLIVAGVSNWGAYALAAGVYVLRGVKPPADLFDPDREREILEVMVREGPLVDGVTGKQTATVDGLTWDEYVEAARPHPRDSGVVMRTDLTDATGADVRAGLPARRARRADARPRPRLRAGQPRRPAARLGLRLPAVLPAEPEAVPAARRDRARRPGTAAASPRAPTCAPTCPRYRVWRDGELVDEPTDVHRHWRDDLVAFRDRLLVHVRERPAGGGRAGAAHRAGRERADVPHEHRRAGRRARFAGRWSCRCGRCTPAQAVRATQICAALPAAHGAPVHFGDPAAIGIARHRPARFRRRRWRSAPGEVPVFWACGVTPQAVLMQAKPPFAITHKPGHMFLTDLKDTDLEGE